MKKTIWKYILDVKDVQKVNIQAEAEILTVQNQNGQVCLWALVDPTKTATEERVIEIFGTGHPIVIDMGVTRKYISTFQMNGGSLVFHAFEYTGI